MSRSKRLNGVANAALTLDSWRHRFGGGLSPQSKLLQSLVFLLLLPDVVANHHLIPSSGRKKVPPRPETLPRKVPLSFRVHPCEVNRTFPLDVSRHVRYRVLRWYRDHYVHVSGYQISLLDLAFCVAPTLETSRPSASSVVCTTPSFGPSV